MENSRNTGRGGIKKTLLVEPNRITYMSAEGEGMEMSGPFSRGWADTVSNHDGWTEESICVSKQWAAICKLPSPSLPSGQCFFVTEYFLGSLSVPLPIAEWLHNKTS